MSLSVLVLGELRKGVERVRTRDTESALALDRWLGEVVRGFSDRILPISSEVADAWGRINAIDPLPVVDSLLAATALVYDMTLVTRNVAGIARTGVVTENPFATG